MTVPFLQESSLCISHTMEHRTICKDWSQCVAFRYVLSTVLTGGMGEWVVQTWLSSSWHLVQQLDICLGPDTVLVSWWFYCIAIPVLLQDQQLSAKHQGTRQGCCQREFSVLITESAHWADSVRKFQCLSVCLCNFLFFYLRFLSLQ